MAKHHLPYAGVDSDGGRVQSGRLSSPHLVRYTERVRVQGQELRNRPTPPLLRRLNRHAVIFPDLFRVRYAVGVVAVQAGTTCVVILEVGLGGRLDATNIVDAMSR